MKELISMPGLILPEDSGIGANARGVIVAANDSRFTAGTPQTELTAFASSLVDRENLEAELERVAPSCPAPRRFSFRKAADADFLSESDDVREIGAAFKKVMSTGTEVTSKTRNKGLTVTLDKDEMVDGDQQRWAASLTRRLFRNDLIRSYAGLIAAATANALAWNSAASPDADVANELTLGGDARGFDGNTVVFGGSAWLYRFAAYSAATRTNGGSLANLTPEQLAVLLSVDNVVVSKSRKQSTASAKAKILGGYVLTYFAQPNPTRDDASNIKRFVTPATGGGKVAVFVEEKAKTMDITVEQYSEIVITSTTGIRSATVTNTAPQG